MIGFAVSIPLMVAMWVPLGISMQLLGYLMFVIATPVFAYVPARSSGPRGWRSATIRSSWT